jgi:thiamine transport system ATP-binding protein
MTLGLPLRLEGVRFAYGETKMEFDLSVAAAEVAAVMGPSGSGKSTLLNLIAGFELPSRGRILVGEQEVTAMQPARRPVSMIFQENNLFAHLDLFSNVALGRNASLSLSAQDRASVAEALGRTGLAGKERRLPRELSGGERQRAALARALVRRRPVLLMDEPFASLGPGLRGEMADLVGELHRETGMTILVVTHSPEDALALAPRLLFVEGGRVVADGPARQLLGEDAPDAVRRYIGERHSVR